MKNEVSWGIFVYNEEKNIRKLLHALSSQKTKKIKIKEIIFVSSGSTDNTDSIIRDFQKKNKKVKLIVEKERKGKASAINLFLNKAKGEIAAIESGDTIPREDCIEELCKPFLEEEKLGVTGVRAIPVNDKKTFFGYISHFDWGWMSYKLPRMGEMIAFRKKVVDQIPMTSVDEAYIEAFAAKHGYKRKAIGTAIVANKGSQNLKDLISQRRRNYMGHKYLIREMGHSVEIMGVSSIKNIIRYTLEYLFHDFSIKHLIWLFFGACIEVYSRILGFIDMNLRKSDSQFYYIWRKIKR